MTTPEELPRVSLQELGRWLAGRTGSAEFAKLGYSSAPQERFDALMLSLLRDPLEANALTVGQLMALIARIEDPRKAAAAREALWAHRGGEITETGAIWEHAAAAAAEVAGSLRACADAVQTPEAEAHAREWERRAELARTGALTGYVLKLEKHLARLCGCLEEARDFAQRVSPGTGHNAGMWNAAISEARAALEGTDNGND